MASIRIMTLKLWRRAIICTNYRLSPPGAGLPRYAHNSLYQMVKKRSLEARTKLQQNPFPNKPLSSQKSTKPSCPPKPNQETESDSKAKTNPCADKQPPICQNTHVLSAADCNITKKRLEIVKGDGAGCMKPGGDFDGKGPSEGDKKPDDGGGSKLWLALLAALGAGGLLFYLLSGGKDEKAIKDKFADKDGGVGKGEDGSAAAGGLAGKDGADKDSDGAGQGSNGSDKDSDGAGQGNKGAGQGSDGAGQGSNGAGQGSDGAGKGKNGAGKGKDDGGLKGARLDPDAAEQGGGELLPNGLPKAVPYLLIGGGTAAFSAFRAIKTNDATAKVLMISNEERKPYMRPPLSKELWYSSEQGEPSKDLRFKQWTGRERSLYFEPDEFYMSPSDLPNSGNGGLAIAHGFSVKRIDSEKRIATLCDGSQISFDECLIATGCTPKNLPVFANAPTSVKERVILYRNPDDFEKLKKYVDENKSVTIVGNGFIGSELACSLASYGKDQGIKIYQVYPESGNMSKVLPEYLSKWTTRRIETQGVCVIPGANIKDVKRDEGTLQLKLSDGSSILTDVVVVSVGCEPNESIARVSGLEVDGTRGGIVVNAELEARRNVYAAGDVACFYDPLLGRRRVEHHDHSVVSGRLAGENMTGKKKSFTHQSMFWSDLGPEIGYEGIGLVDSSLSTVGVFALAAENEQQRSDNLSEEEAPAVELKSSSDLPEINCDQPADKYERGVIFYLKNEKIVGILLWNLFNRIGLARTILNENKKYEDLKEVAKLFEIHA